MPGVPCRVFPCPGVPLPGVPLPGVPLPGVPLPGVPVPVPAPGVPVPAPGVPLPGVWWAEWWWAEWWWAEWWWAVVVVGGVVVGGVVVGGVVVGGVGGRNRCIGDEGRDHYVACDRATAGGLRTVALVDDDRKVGADRAGSITDHVPTTTGARAGPLEDGGRPLRAWEAPGHVGAATGPGAVALVQGEGRCRRRAIESDVVDDVDVHTVVLPPSMLDPLHWCTALITSDEFTVCVVQGPSVQTWVTTVAEDVEPLALMLLVIVIEQVSVSAAPRASAAWPLHWENPTVLADAGVDSEPSTTALRPVANTAAVNTAAMIWKRRRLRGRSLVELNMLNTPQT